MEKPPIHFDWYVNYVTKKYGGKALQRLLQTNLPQDVYKADFMLGVMKEYIRFGKPTFCVGPRMQRMFRDTDCNRVPLCFFNPPHRCFFVSLPHCDLKIHGGERTGYHPVRGFYVYHPPETPSLIGFFIWAAANENSLDPGDDSTFNFALSLDNIARTEVEGVVLCDFSTAVESILSKPSTVPDDPTRRLKYIIPDEAKKNLIEVMRIGVGLILYLNSLEPEVKTTPSKCAAAERELVLLRERTRKPKVIRQAERRVAGLSRVPITWIGATWEARPLGNVATGAGGGAWLTRRGHMHHFWVGPRKDVDGTRRLGDKLVLKWVAPIYRDVVAITASAGRQFRMLEERTDWERKPKCPSLEDTQHPQNEAKRG